MISGGNATVYVSNMEKSIQFYSETLGLTVDQRYGNEWVELKAADGFVIGLCPAEANRPFGKQGSIEIGLNVHGKLESVISTLTSRGVHFSTAIEEKTSLPSE